MDVSDDDDPCAPLNLSSQQPSTTKNAISTVQQLARLVEREEKELLRKCMKEVRMVADLLATTVSLREVEAC